MYTIVCNAEKMNAWIYFPLPLSCLMSILLCSSLQQGIYLELLSPAKIPKFLSSFLMQLQTAFLNIIFKVHIQGVYTVHSVIL